MQVIELFNESLRHPVKVSEEATEVGGFLFL